MSSFLKQFGGKITTALKEQYSKSDYWDGNKFNNLEETTMNISFQDMPGLLRKQLCGRADRAPKKPLEIIPFHKSAFLNDSENAKAVWYGHSVLLLRINGLTLLIDPMFGPNASPIAPFATKRFSEKTLEIIDELPEIDILLLSHDHYDHIDYESIQKLKPKVRKYYVALGIGRHLKRWGIDTSIITEFNWYEEVAIKGIKIIYTPSRHFSGRGISDRAKSLWGGWIFRTADQNIYFSGDGGYGNHFKAIGEKYGPFDFGFIECGQYNELWHAIHMYPEEAVQASIDAGVKIAMPVHWGAFSLAMHQWTDPVERFVVEAEKKGLPIFTPLLGQIFEFNEINNNLHWWKI